MAYDIYGNILRRGYCEVHPQMNEEYPCSICLAENDRKGNEYRLKVFQKQVAHLQAENDQLKQENERLRGVLIELDAWHKFHGRPSYEEIHKRIQSVLDRK